MNCWTASIVREYIDIVKSYENKESNNVQNRYVQGLEGHMNLCQIKINCTPPKPLKNKAQVHENNVSEITAPSSRIQVRGPQLPLHNPAHIPNSNTYPIAHPAPITLLRHPGRTVDCITGPAYAFH